MRGINRFFASGGGDPPLDPGDATPGGRASGRGLRGRAHRSPGRQAEVHSVPMTPRVPLALALAVVALRAVPAAADTQAVSETLYEDTSVGYAIKPMRGWEPKPRKSPGDPMAQNEAGGWYLRPNPKKSDEMDGVACEVLKFGSYFGEVSRAVATGADKPDGKGDDGKGGDGGGDGKGGEPGTAPEQKDGPKSLEDIFGKGLKSFDDCHKVMEKQYRQRGWYLDIDPKPQAMGDDDGRLWEGVLSRGSTKVHVIGASVRRGDFEVAVLYYCPDGKWFVRDFRGALRSSAKSLRILPEAKMRKAKDVLDKKLLGIDAEAAYAEKAIAALPPGWLHHKTANYVLVYDKSVENTNPGLVKRIAFQLERLRADIYEKVFPAARAITARSIVKITQDPAQYAAYGAPPGSAGYWSWPSRELVFFCAQKDVDVTLDVLNHEAFHQYIFYAVGQVSPHSWFNEGHGDYFAGFNLKEGKFTPGKFHWRQKTIQEAIESNTYVPLSQFLSFDQNKYYGRLGNAARAGGDIRQNYAQGWSLVWFLRTTKDERYTGILDRYFDAIKAEVAKWRAVEEAAAAAEGREPFLLLPAKVNQEACEAALQAAFYGVRLEDLEKDWIASKPY